MQVNDLEIDFLKEYDFVIGIDEAGRGPWAGPVSVGAVCVSKDNLFKLSDLQFLRDSKKLSSSQRKKLEVSIQEIADFNFVSDISVELIDEINILEATKLGILTSLKEIYKIYPNKSFGILIDGKFPKIKESIHEIIPNFDVLTVISGDSLCPSISAAAILAKEHRDKLMIELHKIYPEYAFDKHKGYGTKLHTDRLNVFGPSKIHRKSFAPIKKFL